MPQGKSKHEAASYRGDRAALLSAAQPPAKQLPAHLLQGNYFHKFLRFCDGRDDTAAIEAFMLAKLEPQRFSQWAGALRLTLSRRLTYNEGI